MTKKYFLFIIALLSQLSGNAQLSTTEKQELLQKIDDALSNVKTVVYKIDYKDKRFSSRDTMRSIAVCSLYIAPKDKMDAYNSVDALREITDSYPGMYQRMKYDGKKSLFATTRVDSLHKLRTYISSDRREKQGVVQGYSSLLLTGYFTEKKLFGKLSAVTEKLPIKEEMLNGVPVYVITFAPEDTEDYRDRVVRQYIRKSDYLPVAVSSFMRWENMEEYNYTEVDYLAINPDIPVEAFKVTENETVDARERYKTFKEMVKI
jgi:hypothetical protein